MTTRQSHKYRINKEYFFEKKTFSNRIENTLACYQFDSEQQFGDILLLLGSPFRWKRESDELFISFDFSEFIFGNCVADIEKHAARAAEGNQHE